jgi:ABC-2 type transport system permease protein
MKANKENFKDRLRIIWAIAVKDIVDALKNKTTLSVMLGVALLMLGNQALPLILSLEETPTALVYDPGESQWVAKLREREQLDLIPVTSQETLKTTIQESSQEGLIGLVIPINFDQTVDLNEEIQIEAYSVYWADPEEVTQVANQFEAQMSDIAGINMHINLEGNALYPQPDSGGRPFMLAMSLVVVIITISSIIVPYTMIEEKEIHTMDALLVSPASHSEIVIGKAIAGMVFGVVAAGVVFAFNRALVVHWELAIIATLCGTLMSVGIGLLLGTLFENVQNLAIWSGLPLLVLLVPLFLSEMISSRWPGVIQGIISWIPSVSLSRAFLISFSADPPVGQYFLNLGVVLGFAILFLAAVVWVVRRYDR